MSKGTKNWYTCKDSKGRVWRIWPAVGGYEPRLDIDTVLPKQPTIAKAREAIKTSNVPMNKWEW